MVHKKNADQTLFEYYVIKIVTLIGSLMVLATDILVTTIMENLVYFQKPKSVTNYHLHVAKILWKVRKAKNIQK